MKEQLQKAFPAAQFESDGEDGLVLVVDQIRLRVQRDSTDGFYTVDIFLNAVAGQQPFRLSTTRPGELIEAVHCALASILSWNSQICTMCTTLHSILCPDLYMDPADR